jgi:hypothetical protein
MCKRAGILIGVILVAGACLYAQAASASSSGRRQLDPATAVATELSAQTRTAERPRIRVYPLPGPLRRECVPVFQERWIPQWGGWVLYAGQRCWWTRAPA